MAKRKRENNEIGFRESTKINSLTEPEKHNHDWLASGESIIGDTRKKRKAHA